MMQHDKQPGGMPDTEMSPRLKRAVGWAAALGAILLLTPLGPMTEDALVERPRLAMQRMTYDHWIPLETATLADCDSRVTPVPRSWSPVNGLTDAESANLEKAANECRKGEKLSGFNLALAQKASDLIWKQSYYCMRPDSEECRTRHEPDI